MAGYTRVDTINNIADGNVINAADLDGEFDGIQSAFNSSTGHNHDGTAGEGAPILALGPVQDVTISASVLGVKTTNTVDLGTSSLKFKDFYLAGAASIGGTLGVTGATTLSAALTYGGVTLSNAVTGTGNMVLSASPTLTGTITAAAANFSGAVALNGNTTLGDADTDTITQAASYVTGTQLKSAKTATNTLSLAAYDVDGTAYTNLITLTASNTPTLALTSTGVGTINNMSVGATTASTGAFTTLSATGVATFSAGSAAAPAITTTGDTNTGIWFPTADTIAFTEGGVESMRIDSAGNVGIGTSSPDELLTVLGNIHADGSGSGSGTFGPFVEIGRTNGPRLQATQDGADNDIQGLAFFTKNSGVTADNPTERMRIDSSGNLGIGTSSPSTKLHVTGAITAATTGQFFVSNGASTTNQYFNVLNSGGSFFLGVENSSGGSLATGSSAYASLLTTQGATPLQFGTNLNVRATIDSSGNVGIGTTNIQERLTVQNNIQITNSASNLSGIYFGTNANPAQRYSYIESDGRSTGYINFNTNALERARIDSSGNLGIGTSSPLARLNISGGTTIASLTDWNSKANTVFTLANAAQRLGIGYSAADIPLIQGFNSTNDARDIAMQVYGGNVGIGVTPSANAGQKTLSIAPHTGSFTALTLGSNFTQSGYIGYNMGNTGTNSTWKYISADTGSALWFNGNEYRFMQFASGSAGATTNGTQAMTLDSSGNLIVNGTAAGVVNNNAFWTSTSAYFGQNHTSGTSSGTNYAYFAYNGSTIGSISQSGTTAVLYNTTSDYRLKENIQPLSGALARVASLKPCTYTWKSAPEEIGEGFIAHELAEVCPQAVSGEKDAVNNDGSIKPQGIDTSFLVATLTAAIQEQQALITQLTARITALEGA